MWSKDICAFELFFYQYKATVAVLLVIRGESQSYYVWLPQKWKYLTLYHESLRLWLIVRLCQGPENGVVFACRFYFSKLFPQMTNLVRPTITSFCHFLRVEQIPHQPEGNFFKICIYFTSPPQPPLPLLLPFPSLLIPTLPLRQYCSERGRLPMGISDAWQIKLT